jgi:hypothetical protein
LRKKEEKRKKKEEKGYAEEGRRTAEDLRGRKALSVPAGVVD